MDYFLGLTQTLNFLANIIYILARKPDAIKIYFKYEIVWQGLQNNKLRL